MSRHPSLSYSVAPGPSLGTRFIDAASRHAQRTALVVGDERISYADLAERAGRIAARLSEAPRATPRLGAVFGSRSAPTYEGVLGTLLSGAGYVPLNPKFPDERNAFMLAVSAASTLVVDAECVHRLEPVLARVTKPLLIVIPHAVDVAELAARHAPHTVLGAKDLEAATPVTSAPSVDLDAIAYLLFTSGSTGSPKGVMVSHANILHHLGVVWDRYGFGENDRCSQMFDLTFDLSVFDMFTSWCSGASLHVVPEKAQLAPDRFIRERELTVWFSVPSVAMMMRSFGLLKAGALPSLRLSLFCGERLPAAIAEAWHAAAPQARLDNIYGPTEVTVGCTAYTWNPESSPAECRDGGVPIGVPFPGMAAAVLDEKLELVRYGEIGELCMRGPQVTPGYWLDSAKTNERYVSVPWESGPENRWYRTGDLAFLREDGNLIHCGRLDEQIKLHGHRIELTEIEHVLRDVAQTDFAAVIAHPRDENGPRGLVACVARTELSQADILREAKKRLPAYMVPQRVAFMADFPLNANGKIDKKRLAEMLAAEGPSRAT